MPSVKEFLIEFVEILWRRRIKNLASRPAPANNSAMLKKCNRAMRLKDWLLMRIAMKHFHMSHGLQRSTFRVLRNVMQTLMMNRIAKRVRNMFQGQKCEKRPLKMLINRRVADYIIQIVMKNRHDLNSLLYKYLPQPIDDFEGVLGNQADNQEDKTQKISGYLYSQRQSKSQPSNLLENESVSQCKSASVAKPKFLNKNSQTISKKRKVPNSRPKSQSILHDPLQPSTHELYKKVQQAEQLKQSIAKGEISEQLSKMGMKNSKAIGASKARKQMEGILIYYETGRLPEEYVQKFHQLFC